MTTGGTQRMALPRNIIWTVRARRPAGHSVRDRPAVTASALARPLPSARLGFSWDAHTRTNPAGTMSGKAQRMTLPRNTIRLGRSSTDGSSTGSAS